MGIIEHHLQSISALNFLGLHLRTLQQQQAHRLLWRSYMSSPATTANGIVKRALGFSSTDTITDYLSLETPRRMKPCHLSPFSCSINRFGLGVAGGWMYLD